jgi:UDP-GlcNAc:undecaprenyl-phosphate GlcNAc-1-phosphate transferase
MLIGVSSSVFLLGLADDILHLRPRAKLLAQLAAAVWILSSGAIDALWESSWVTIAVSLVWIVGITNAFNLLDNMDGLSAGVAIIAAIYLAVFYAGSGNRDYAVMISIAAGAAAGFLIFNFSPARIFMGDSGSLFLGFLLGTASLLEVTQAPRVRPLVLAPVAVLAIPIFDTFFVSITRWLRGQPISEGGTDHSSHRLVRLGLNERDAVLLLYALSASSGAVAVAMRHVFYRHAIGLIAVWILFLVLFGIHLFRAEPMVGASNGHRGSDLRQRLLTRLIP